MHNINCFVLLSMLRQSLHALLSNLLRSVKLCFTWVLQLVREPAILLIKWLRPKGLKVCSYVKKYAEFKNQTLKKTAGTQNCYVQRNTPRVGKISN